MLTSLARPRSMALLLVGIILGGVALVSVLGGAGARDAQRGEHRAFAPLVAKDAEGPFADLVLIGAGITIPDPNDCTQRSNLGTRIVVRNDGAVDSGPFYVVIEGEALEFAFLSVGAGETASEWFSARVPTMREITLTIDAPGAPESDLSNNSLTLTVPLPTPVPECTPASGG